MCQKQVLLLALLLEAGVCIYPRNRENVEVPQKVSILYGDSKFLPLLAIADDTHFKNIGNMFCGTKDGNKFCFEITDSCKVGKIECNAEDGPHTKLYANCKYIAPK